MSEGNFDTQNNENFAYSPEKAFEKPLFSGYTVSEEQKEKEKIKKFSFAAGTAFLASNLLVRLLNYAVIYGMRFFGMRGADINSFLSEPAIQQTFQITFSIITFTLPFIVVFKLFGFRISSLISFKTQQKGVFIPFVFLGLGLCAFANIAANYISAFFETFGINYEVNFGKEPDGIFGLALTFIATVITPALFEEFACRGIVLGAGKPFSEKFAIIVSAFMFGMMHGNFEQIPFAFLIGLILGYVTVKSGSVWAGMTIHALNNVMPLILDLLGKHFSATTQNVIYTVYLTVNLLLAIIAVWMLNGKTGIFELKGGKTKLKDSERFKTFFLNPLVIIFVVLAIFKSFKYFV